MFILNRFMYEAAAGGGGGLPPSMVEIEEAARKARENGGGDPVIPEGKMKDANGNIVDDPNYKKPDDQIPEGKMKNDKGEIVDDPNYKKPEGGDDEIPEGKMRNEAGEIVDDPNYKPDEGGEMTPEDFWKAVEEQTGRPVKVEYPEGVDPLSPQGVVIRENAVRQAAMDEWEATLKARNPRGYAFMMHVANGRPEEEFFDDGGYTLPERGTVETDTELQSTIIKADLISRGVEEDIADATIAKYVKANTLKDKALKLYDDEAKRQTDHIAALETERRNEQVRVDGLISNLNKQVGELFPALDFVVPEAQKAELQKFIMNNVELDPKTNQFYIIQKLEADPKKQLEGLLFQFFKGDLNKIVKKKVSTNASQRLRTAALNTKTTTKQGEETSTNQPQYVPLGSLGNGVPKT